MRKLSAVLLAIFLAFTSFPALAEEVITFPCGNGANYKVQMPEGVLTDGEKCGGSLVIDNSVKIIGFGAFWRAAPTQSALSKKLDGSKLAEAYVYLEPPLTSITIPNSVTAIDDYAFRREQFFVNVNVFANTIISITFNTTKLQTIGQIFLFWKHA